MTSQDGPWIWEFRNNASGYVLTTEEFESREAARDMIDACFTSYRWFQVDRGGVTGEVVLVEQHGQFVDTGHWIYPKPQSPFSREELEAMRARTTRERDRYRAQIEAGDDTRERRMGLFMASAILGEVDRLLRV